MPDLNPYMIWIKLAGAVLIVASIFGAGMWLEGTIKDKTISSMKLEKAAGVAKDTQDALDQFTKDAASIHGSADAFQGVKATFETSLTAISKDFANAIKAKPLPAGCAPDAGRMRALSAAIQAANSAGAGLRAVPAVPRPQ